MSVASRYFPHADLPFVNGAVTITPEMANWKFCGLSIFELKANIAFEVDSSLLAKSEGALIPLNVSGVEVKVDGQLFTLEGRLGVFAGASDWIYCRLGSKIEITSSTNGEIALATARAVATYPTLHVPALESIEIRGSGDATREVRPFMHPENFPGADRLMAVELITPDGNVSSYPPHRHDGIEGCDVANEEIYYFRIGKLGQLHGDPEGFGFHRTYTAPQDPTPFDDNLAIHDGDIYLVPRGYHGPSTAMPGYPMYYLNVLAGDTPARTMDFCDDPNHAWIRKSWASQKIDPRVPWKVM